MAITLASSSSIRHAMLEAAGVPHSVTTSTVDEAAIKAVHDGDDRSLVLALAGAKARSVTHFPSEHWLIGADSLVSVEGRRYDKPSGRDEAAAHLRAFSGKIMTLTSAVALARDGSVEWSHAESARLHVRHLSDTFIHNYLKDEWPAVGHCVGVFRMEGPGVQLFERIEGDYFTILGMPLLPLLGALRESGELPS